jgi:Ca2+-binding EF-hand superfamily protein
MANSTPGGYYSFNFHELDVGALEEFGLDLDQIEELHLSFVTFTEANMATISGYDLATKTERVDFHKINPVAYYNIKSYGHLQIDFKEFLRIVTKKLELPKTENDARHLFQMFKGENRGIILTEEELRVLNYQMRDVMSDEQIAELLIIGQKGKYQVTVNDFIRVLLPAE